MAVVSVTPKAPAGVGVSTRGVRGPQGPALELRDEDGVIEWRIAGQTPADEWKTLLDIAQYVEDSETARNLAQQWATEDEDVAVSGGLYSAFHHALKAAASASAASGSAGMAASAQSDAEAARDLAAGWAEKADGVDVDGAGTRSAKHHAGVASSAASTATIKASEASGFADAAELAKNAAQDAASNAASDVAGLLSGYVSSASGHADDAKDASELAQEWAAKEEDAEVAGGLYSALHYAAKAAASALAAASFDPSSYYLKSETYTKGETNSAISSAIDGVINGAPGALDTLNELAAALGGDPDFATTVLNALAAKADAVHSHTASQISDASANGRSLITAANYAAMRTLLGLVVGTNVQAHDADTAKTDVEQTWSAAQLFGQIGTSVLAMGSGTAINCSANNAFSRTVSGNVTFTITNVPASRSFGISLLMTYTSGTVIWPASIKWADDTAPTLTGGKTYLVLLHTTDGGSTWRGAANEYAG